MTTEALERWRAEPVGSIRSGPLSLPLRRYGDPKAGRSVLLLHGANTGSDMFLLPGGGIVKYLADRRFDVWTLDWRGSPEMMRQLQDVGFIEGSAARERAHYTFDAVATEDISKALEAIRQEVGPRVDLGVFGFCAGAGALAMAVGRGVLEPFRIERLVFVTLGLFYETPWDGWLKAEDFLLERVVARDPSCRSVDPKAPRFPEPLETAFQHWPSAWLLRPANAIEALFRRLTFMYGEPYCRARVPAEVERHLPEVIGPLHLGLYQHAGQLVRRGFAARFGAADVVDRARGPGRAGIAGESDLDPTFFRGKRVTSITGAENRLWHRDSIDLMHEWLLGHVWRGGAERRPRKHVFRDYGHLDLFWANEAARDVYPAFVGGLE